MTPKVAFNAAAYSLDQAPEGRPRHPGRVVPTLSLDAGWILERDVSWFGKAQRQTLEPRLLYLNTPYRNQLDLPNFDSADREFNLVSLFGENAFSGRSGQGLSGTRQARVPAACRLSGWGRRPTHS